MKKVVILLIFMLFSTYVFSHPVEIEKAELISKNWSTNFNNNSQIKNSICKKVNGESVLYIYNFEKGWIMISADDNIKPILGFSFDSNYSEENEPDALKSLFEYYHFIQKETNSSNQEYSFEWEDVLSGSFGNYHNNRDVDPLIPVLWSQDWPYNAYCPADTTLPWNYNGHLNTSCGPTAFAQILRYWSYPIHGIGYHSYFYDEFGLVEADFGSTYYNWGNMPVSLDFYDTELVYCDVATLMYHCGVSIDDSYGSGASLGKYTSAAVKYFNYSPTCKVYYRDNFTSQEWHNIFRQELNNGHPIMIEGNAAGSAAPWQWGTYYGHYFVCDGYYGEDYYHINWGWEGNANGYYPLYEFGNDLSNGGFIFHNHALIGLEPNYENHELILADPYSVDDNTIVLLHFDGNYNNESDLSDDPTTHGSNISFADNSALGLGQCLYLDNSNQNNCSYLSISDNDNLDLSGDWTIEMWFKTLSIGNNWNEKFTLLNKTGVDNYFESNYSMFMLPTSDFCANALICSYFPTEPVDNTPDILTDRNFLEMGNWYHASYIRDTSNKTLKLLIHNSNRELVHYECTTYYNEVDYQPLLNSNPLYIGTSLYSETNYDGYIDELRISNIVRTFYDVLHADFSVDINSGYAPLTVNFTDLSIGNPTSWEWDFENDGTIDSCEQDPTHTYSEAGIYTVSLTASDGTNTDTEIKTDYIYAFEIVQPAPALQFDGIDDYAQVTDFIYPTSDLTIEAWIKPDQFDTTREIIFGINPGNYNTIQFRLESDGSLLYGESPDWTYVSTPDPCIELNEWNHVAVVRESGLCKLYINGEQLAEGIVNEGVNPTVITIGGRYTNMDRFYDGTIVDVRMWEIARSQSEIQANMNCFLDGSENGLIAYWRMNEGNGQTIFDLSNSGYDLQLGSTPDPDTNDPAWILTNWPYEVTLTANFSADVTSGIAPLMVNFTDLSTGAPTSWEWDFQNDGTIDSNEQNPEWIYNEQGTYTVSLTVSDGTNTDTEIKVDYITVGEPIVADFEAIPTEGLIPLDVQFTDLSIGGLPAFMRESKNLNNSKNAENDNSRDIVSWEWDFDNDGTIDSYEQDPSNTYSEAGIYTVSLTVSDGTNSDEEIKVDYITVGEPIVADFSANPTEGLLPLDVQFTDLSTGGLPALMRESKNLNSSKIAENDNSRDIISWEWDFDNDGTIDSYEQNPSNIYSEAGIYTVSLTVSDGTNTTTETKVDYITVGEPIIADFEAIPTEGLLPLDVQFTDLSSGGLPALVRESKNLNNSKIAENDNSRDIVSWEWDFDNDGTIDSNEQNPTYTYTEAGLYTVSLTVSDGTNTDTEIKVDYINVSLTGAEIETIPLETMLIGSYPNPFNPSTTIRYDLKESANVRIQVFNIKGQIVATLVNQNKKAGKHSIVWNGNDDTSNSVSSGLYLYKLIVNDKTLSIKKCLLLK